MTRTKKEVVITSDISDVINYVQPKGRICHHCGWEYPPIDYQRTRCRFCGRKFDTQFCQVCKREYKTEEFNTGFKLPYRICRTCKETVVNKKGNVNSVDKKRLKVKLIAELDKHYDIMKMKAKLQHKQTMTEVRHTLVSYYNGHCAICDEEIAAFQMLLKSVDGGKICPENVIPVCARHNQILLLDKNPLIAMIPLYNHNSTQRREIKVIAEICGYKNMQFIRRELDRYGKLK